MNIFILHAATFMILTNGGAFIDPTVVYTKKMHHKKKKKKSLNFFQIVPETIWITTTGPTVRSRGWVLRVVLVLAYCYWYRWPKSKDYTYLKNSQILIYKSRFFSYYICKGGFSCLRMLQRCFAIKLQKCFVDNKTSSDLPSLWRWVDNDSTCIFGWPVHLNSSTSNTHQTQNMLEIKSHEKSVCASYCITTSMAWIHMWNSQLSPVIAHRSTSSKQTADWAPSTYRTAQQESGLWDHCSYDWHSLKEKQWVENTGNTSI